MEPLILSSEGRAANLMRQERFKNMVNNSIRPRLSSVENSRFLERFRYSLVSSPLLDKQLLGYTSKLLQKGTLNAKAKFKFGHRANKDTQCSYCSTGGASVIEQRYWMGGGGCIIVLVVLLSWAVKSNKYGLTPGTRAYTVALIVISFGVTIFLFSYSRRRLLRNLRTQILFNTTQFLEHSQNFDLALTKSLSTIREAELLSRGYRPDLTDNSINSSLSMLLGAPASRIEKAAHRDGIVMGKHLRASVSAGLYLCTSTCLSAIEEIRPYCNEPDLEKYLDIYELDLSDIDEFGWEKIGVDNSHVFREFVQREGYYGAPGANASLEKMKFDLFKLHFLRRLLICCLLSLPTSGRCSPEETGSWHLVNSHLEVFSNLTNQLSHTLTPNRIMTSIGMSDKVPETNSQSETWQKQVRSLNHISSTLQHIEARMEILRDSSMGLINNTWKESEDIQEIDPSEQIDQIGENREIYGVVSSEDDFRELEDDFERNFGMIGDDIQSLLSQWESGKKDLAEAIKKRRGNHPLFLSTSGDYNEKAQQNDFYKHNSMMALSPTGTDMESVLTMSADLLSPTSKSANRNGNGNGHERGYENHLNFMAHHRRQSSEMTSFSGATVLEGVSADLRGSSSNNKPTSVLSRQERIKKMKQERANEADRRAAALQRNYLVEELGSVLDYRTRSKLSHVRQ